MLGLMLFCLFRPDAAGRRQREETARIFEPYRPETDRLSFRGELVRYFEDIVDENHRMTWPNRDGTVDVRAVCGQAGELEGVEPFDSQSFADRTPSLSRASCELQITDSVDGYTPEREEQVDSLIESALEDAYAPYAPYGLIYDRARGRLYYEGRLVGYFEDAAIGHTFGPYEDSPLKIRAERDSRGKLTGLAVEGDESR